MKQNSEAWEAARKKKVTASGAINILKGVKGGYLKSRETYMNFKIAERLVDFEKHNITSKSIRSGKENEPIARAVYEAENNCIVEEVGFIDHPTIEMFGASPDGIIKPNGGCEIKCLDTANHISKIRAGRKSFDKGHIVQMNCGMMCTGADWWDYILFDPSLPVEVRLKVYRFEADKELMEEIEAEVNLFNLQVDAIVKSLQEGKE